MSAEPDQQAREGQPPSEDAMGMNATFHAHDLLVALLTAERANILQVVVGNFDRRAAALLDWPPGMGGHSKRLIVPRSGQGQNGLIIASAVVTEVCEQNEGRLGGLIVNSGAAPCRLYFCSPGDIGGPGNALSATAPQRASTWLGANGGAFDFRMGNALYGGTVCAAGIGGATTIDWAEF